MKHLLKEEYLKQNGFNIDLVKISPKYCTEEHVNEDIKYKFQGICEAAVTLLQR